MEINGLPLHPLIVHATVVLIPLAALLALVYAGMPRLRWATRWPMAAAALAALGSVVAAYLAGRDFLSTLEQPGGKFEAGQSAVIMLHQERAEVLLWLTVVFSAFTLMSVWGLGGPSSLASGRGQRTQASGVIEWSLVTMLVVLAVSLILMTIATGEAGARSVWG
jgi:uncharacterized membrane protein